MTWTMSKLLKQLLARTESLAKTDGKLEALRTLLITPPTRLPCEIQKENRSTA